MSLSPKDVVTGLSQMRPLMEKEGRDPESLWVGRVRAGHRCERDAQMAA